MAELISDERRLAQLAKSGIEVLGLAELTAATGLGDASTRSLARRLIAKGLLVRLRQGLYALPPVLDRGRIALVPAIMKGQPYYLGYSSAMQIHDMTTQPVLQVTVATTRSKRDEVVGGQGFRFVRCARDRFFGLETMELDSALVVVSDLERTIVDCLDKPRYGGGVSEVSRGMWLRRLDLDFLRLLEYARRMESGAVVRRLGFVLSTLRMLPREELEQLQRQIGRHYDVLDPTLDVEGARYNDAWRLRVNVLPDELLENLTR